MQAFVGFGLIFGTPLASFVYGIGGYTWTFYVFAIMLTVNTIACLFLIPSELNNKGKTVAQIQITTDNASISQINIDDAFKAEERE